MRSKILATALLLLPACNRQMEEAKATPQQVLVEVSPITSKEEAIFARIKRAYPDFHFSNSVKRYYELQGAKRVPIQFEMVFSRSEDPVFKEFVGYEVRFDPALEVVHYGFDAGTSNRGHGSILVSGAGLTRTEFSCGVSSCVLEVRSNGTIVHEAQISNDYYSSEK